MDINIQVIEKYTRAVKLRLYFDKNEKEQIFFIPITEVPILIEKKTILCTQKNSSRNL
jgi:hypothetical protein